MSISPWRLPLQTWIHFIMFTIWNKCWEMNTSFVCVCALMFQHWNPNIFPVGIIGGGNLIGQSRTVAFSRRMSRVIPQGRGWGEQVGSPMGLVGRISFQAVWSQKQKLVGGQRAISKDHTLFPKTLTQLLLLQMFEKFTVDPLLGGRKDLFNFKSI